MGHLDLGKSNETAFQHLHCNLVRQQALLATYPTGTQKENKMSFILKINNINKEENYRDYNKRTRTFM
jgi:hypothetical protein